MWAIAVNMIYADQKIDIIYLTELFQEHQILCKALMVCLHILKHQFSLSLSVSVHFSPSPLVTFTELGNTMYSEGGGYSHNHW